MRSGIYRLNGVGTSSRQLVQFYFRHLNSKFEFQIRDTKMSIPNIQSLMKCHSCTWYIDIFLRLGITVLKYPFPHLSWPDQDMFYFWFQLEISHESWVTIYNYFIDSSLCILRSRSVINIEACYIYGYHKWKTNTINTCTCFSQNRSQLLSDLFVHRPANFFLLSNVWTNFPQYFFFPSCLLGVNNSRADNSALTLSFQYLIKYAKQILYHSDIHPTALQQLIISTRMMLTNHFQTCTKFIYPYNAHPQSSENNRMFRQENQNHVYAAALEYTWWKKG